MNTKRVSIAVAVSALGLAIAPGVASAADSQVACGTPPKQAVYSTVVVPGTAAVTHEEYEWSSVAEVIEQQWHQWLVDSAAVPAGNYYVRVRGVFCEPLSLRLVEALNARLAEVRRESVR